MATGGGLSSELEGIMTTLRELVARLGGGPVQAAVAGATGDATGGGTSPGVEQLGAPLPKGKVGGESGAGTKPEQHPGQMPEQVGGKRGKGHYFAPGRGHAKHRHAMPQPPAAEVAGATGNGVGQKPVAQVAGPTGAGVEQKPVAQVAGPTGAGVEQKPAAQVAGTTGAGVEQSPVEQKLVAQVGGERGSDTPVVQQPVEQKPVVVPPADAPAVRGDSGSGVEQGPVQQAPVQQKAPLPSDVSIFEVDHGNYQLKGDDGSMLHFDGLNASYLNAFGRVTTLQVPQAGMSMELSDGTRFSLGIHQTDGSSVKAGNPSDLELIAPDGSFYGARTDDGRHTDWTSVPLTAMHLLEIASMIRSGEYTSFGTTPKVVQQS